MSVEKLFELFEKLRFSWFGAAFHGSHGADLITLRPRLTEGAGNILARLLVDTPADGAVALNALIATIGHAFGHVERSVAIMLKMFSS